jgi:hypothetical protein
MKKILAALVVMASSIWLNANAVELKLDLDLTQYQPAPVGNWYQRDMPNTIRCRAVSGAIGIYTDQFYDGWQIGLGVGNAGRCTSDAMIHNVDDCSVGCGPISHMQGQGTMPFGYLMARKTWGSWFAEGGLYVTRPNYENTNFNWYGPPPTYQVGPLVSHIDHAVKNTPGFGAAVGYTFAKNWSAILKIIPTKSTNTQPDPNGSSGQTYYRPIYSGALGYAASIGVQFSY